ncbi:MAG: helix-turn-helix domain-containing protein [Candidatus Pacebacteria bacterium]|nr:helix-turn-helix domain-containing protein [Candidatus Paceibacterota bacterium]
MKIKSVGEILSEERISHNVTIEFLAKKTKIKQEYLEYLEDNQFEKLPSAPFIKGYIKTYARIFGFEYKPLIAVLRRDYKESAKGKLVPREFIKPVLRQKITWNPMTASVMIAGSIFATLALFVIYKWYIFNRPPLLVIYSPDENGEVSSQIIVEGKTDPESFLVVNSQPVTLQPDGSFSTQILMPREGITTITIESTDKRGKTNLLQKTVRVKF